jgi:DHA2 family multidrug resistance protein
MLSGFKALFQSQGFDPVTATHKATAMAYRMVQSQAAALSFKNSFWTMSILIIFLIPLPFIMRRPRPNETRQIAAH